MKGLLNLSLIAVASLIASCSGNGSGKTIVLTNMNDSLSYTSGKHLSRNLRVMASEDMGIDSATIDEFVAGLRASFPVNVTPESKAYAYGMSLGASAMDMYEKTKAQFKALGIDYVDSRLFLEGVVAAICDDGSVVDSRVAADYYNSRKYRDESDAFMLRNSRRSGVKTLAGGLQYRMTHVGKGPVATPADTVFCIYKGHFSNGDIFETSSGEAVELPVADLIPGLQQAVTLFPVGTECTLYVPWQLGYGPRGANGIPPYKTLVFDLEIVSIKKK